MASRGGRVDLATLFSTALLSGAATDSTVSSRDSEGELARERERLASCGLLPWARAPNNSALSLPKSGAATPLSATLSSRRRSCSSLRTTCAELDAPGAAAGAGSGRRSAWERSSDMEMRVRGSRSRQRRMTSSSSALRTGGKSMS